MYFNITEIDWGTASRVDNKIYINKNTKKYPGLYNALINHEKKHTNGWALEDLKLDMHDPELSKHKKSYYKFMFKHPKSFIQYLPISKYNGKWTLDITLLLFEVLALIMFIAILKVLI